MDYLAELMKEKNNLAAFPNYFYHTERLLDIEIARVRTQLFHCNLNEDMKLPDPDIQEERVSLVEKIYVPVKEYPDFNFVGRILGPRGMTAKQLEHETGCKIMVRGRGSMRDEAKEELHRGKPNWEHLEDNLHILVQCEDTKDRARIKLDNAVLQLKKLLIPAPGGIDELKRKQLMELSIIKGTYRPQKKPPQHLLPSLSLVSQGQQALFTPTPPVFHSAFAPKTFFSSPLPSPMNFRPPIMQGTPCSKLPFDFGEFYHHLG